MKTRRVKQRRKYDPERTRQVLVEAAIELFGAKGFRGTSVQELVTHAGLTKGAFYHHFEGKEGIFHAIHDEFIDETLRRQDIVLDHFGTAHEQLYHMLLMLVDIIIEYLPNVSIFFQEKAVLLNGQGFEEVFDKRDQAGRRYIEVIKMGVDNGEFCTDISPRLAAFGLIGMCSWTYQWYSPGGPVGGMMLGETFAKMGLRSVTSMPELAEDIVANAEPLNY